MNDKQWVEVGASGDAGDIWNREEDKEIEGTLVKRQSNVGPNNSMMYTIKTTDGEKSVWGATVLDGKMENVPDGAEVRIKYLGKKKGKRGDFHDFTVSMAKSEEKDDIPDLG